MTTDPAAPVPLTADDAAGWLLASGWMSWPDGTGQALTALHESLDVINSQDVTRAEVAAAIERIPDPDMTIHAYRPTAPGSPRPWLAATWAMSDAVTLATAVGASSAWVAGPDGHDLQVTSADGTAVYFKVPAPPAVSPDVTRDDLTAWPQLLAQLATPDDGYVLPYLPVHLIPGCGESPGWWNLQTRACFDARKVPPLGEWTLEAPPSIPAASLAAWVSRVLGRPVTLNLSSYKFRLREIPEPLIAPLYWVIPC